MPRFTFAVQILFTAALVIASAGAQPPADLTVPQRAALERIALARARAALWSQIAAAPLTPALPLSVWAARDLGRDRALRLWVRQQPAAGPARFYSDGICEIDVCIEPNILAAKLAQLRTDGAAAAAEPTAIALARASADWPIYWGTGSALYAERDTGEKPTGWEDVTFEGIEIARRAATADALQALLDAAGQMKVTNALRLNQFLDSAPAVRSAVQSAFERTATITVTLAPDQVAIAEAALGVNDLIRILTETHQQHYSGDDFHAADFREMTLIIEQGRLSAGGLASPPADTVLKSPYVDIQLDAPPWTRNTLSVSGVYRAGDDERLDRTAQLDAARLDGLDRARTAIESLTVVNDVSVERLLEFAPQLKDDVVLFLSSARAVGPLRSRPDGAVELPLELSLPRLWEILGRALETIEMDALEVAASTQPTSQATSLPTTQPTTTTATASGPTSQPHTQPTP